MLIMHRELLVEKYISPTEITKTGTKICRCIWNSKFGYRHSINGQPALIRYENGELTHKFWYKNDVVYRDKNKPAIICYYKGDILIKLWYKNGEEIKKEYF